MKKIIIGVIGGYGQVGQEAVRYLINETPYNILLGGRNFPNSPVPKQMQGRSSFMPVDIFHDESLSTFCDACDILINCAGPSAVIGDNYPDTGGIEIRIEALIHQCKEVASK